MVLGSDSSSHSRSAVRSSGASFSIASWISAKFVISEHLHRAFDIFSQLAGFSRLEPLVYKYHIMRTLYKNKWPSSAAPCPLGSSHILSITLQVIWGNRGTRHKQNKPQQPAKPDEFSVVCHFVWLSKLFEVNFSALNEGDCFRSLIPFAHRNQMPFQDVGLRGCEALTSAVIGEVAGILRNDYRAMS